VVDNRGRGIARRRKRRKPKESSAKPAAGGRRPRERWSAVGDHVVAAQAGVDLGRILDRLQIVGDRDDREQDQDEHGQGDELRRLVTAPA
jgi:hypothetical protein